MLTDLRPSKVLQNRSPTADASRQRGVWHLGMQEEG